MRKFASFPCSVPWDHLLPDLVEKCRGRSLAETDSRIKTAWSDKQYFCRDSHLRHIKMCSINHSGLCQMWCEVLSPVHSEWFLQYLIGSEILYLPLAHKKGYWRYLRRKLASQSNPFPFQQPAMEDKRSIFLSSIVVQCNGMLAWASPEVITQLKHSGEANSLSHSDSQLPDSSTCKTGKLSEGKWTCPKVWLALPSHSFLLSTLSLSLCSSIPPQFCISFSTYK